MREFTNLGWPDSPYNGDHRPIKPAPQFLLTGLAIGAAGWAAVHLPVHRTKTLTADKIRFGIHTVQLAMADDGCPVDVGGWLVLDRLLLTGRRQAYALAGDDLGMHLAALSTQVETGRLSCPGITSLLPEWPAPATALAPVRAGAARLIELDGHELPPVASSLLGDFPVPALGQGISDDAYLAALVATAAAVAVAGAALCGWYDLGDGVDLPALLDAAAGDLLPFAALPQGSEQLIGAHPAASDRWGPLP